MTKRHYLALEKVFEAEIEAVQRDWPSALFQSGAKVYRELEAASLVKHQVERLGGPLPVTIEGWALTELGRMAYCTDPRTTSYQEPRARSEKGSGAG